MCAICNKHGKGKKWYLISEFYSEELYRSNKREYWAAATYERFENYFSRALKYLGFIKAIPALGRGIVKIAEAILRKEHYGQVIPIDDVSKVYDLATSIYKLPCVCKIVLRGRQDQSHCFGFGVFPETYFKAYADYSEHTEKVSKDEALELTKGLEKKGYIHTIWTYRTPYVGKICNCNIPDCAAFTTQFGYGLLVVHKSEYTFKIDSARCNGCRNCRRQCQFGAVEYLPILNLCRIDPDKCFGCGVCRIACKSEAIVMEERESSFEMLLGEQRKLRRKYRITIDRERCKAPLECRRCLELCPRSVFLIYPKYKRLKSKKSETWEIMPANNLFCTGCMECLDFCPSKAIGIQVR